MPQGFINFGNEVLDSYIKGRVLRKQIEEQQFRHEAETEQARRLEQQRRDAVKHWEDQVKFNRERLQFDRERNDLQEKHRNLQDRAQEWSIRRLGLDMISRGIIPPNLEPAASDVIQQGLNEFQNTGRTEILPFTKKPVEIMPGITLQDYQTPYERGLAEEQVKGPLETLKGQVALQKGEQITDRMKEIRSMIEEGLNRRAQEKEAGLQSRFETKEENLEKRLGITGQQRLDLARANNEAAMERAKYRMSTAGQRKPSGGVKAQEKAATWKRIEEQYDELINLGDKINWSAQSPMGLLPGGIYSKLKASFPGSDTKDMINFRSGIGRVTAEELHKLYGSVLSLGELARASGFIADISNDPSVARDRLEKARDAARREWELLSEVGSEPKETSTPKSENLKWWESYKK